MLIMEPVDDSIEKKGKLLLLTLFQAVPPRGRVSNAYVISPFNFRVHAILG